MQFIDANVLLVMFGLDTAGQRPDLLIGSESDRVSTSDFVMAEVASGLARRVRMREADRAAAQACLDVCDRWVAERCRIVLVTSEDIRTATVFLRRLDLELNLRAPDAVNIATASRLGATLVTFDQRMATAARALGVAAVEP